MKTSVGIARRAVGIQQAADMIRVSVGQQDGINVVWRTSRRPQTGFQHAASRPRVDQNRSSPAADKIAINVNSAGVDDARIALDLCGIAAIDAGQQRQAGGHAAVAKGSHLKIANLAGDKR